MIKQVLQYPLHIIKIQHHKELSIKHIDKPFLISLCPNEPFCSIGEFHIVQKTFPNKYIVSKDMLRAP